MRTRSAFTLLEIVCAVMLMAVVTSLCVATYNAISRGWQVSTEYMDKMQRTDFALNQVVTGLRSMFYPHTGSTDANYGFVLQNRGDGKDADRSDVIEWSKRGTAIVGNKSAVADTVHRVQVMVLEEGDTDWEAPIEVTGLYARHCPDVALRPKDGDIDYTFANDEMYQPILIADGIVGFNCRVLSPDDAEGTSNEITGPEFIDEWENSNSVPCKVELTFFVKDNDERSYRTNVAPLMRIVRIPVYEQSKDGAAPPNEKDARDSSEAEAVARRRRGEAPPQGGGGGRGGGGGAAPPPGGGPGR